jgi:hypothetical protein
MKNICICHGHFKYIIAIWYMYYIYLVVFWYTPVLVYCTTENLATLDETGPEFSPVSIKRGWIHLGSML